jgi:class 3 adenylate cyclase
MMPGDETLVSEERVVMITDIHSFSLVTREVEEQQAEFLQALYEMMGDVICELGGEIIKYLGDGLLCLFPTGQEEAAVACGIRMRREYSQMVEDLGIRTETELEVGIGSGTVTLGEFGHSSMRQKDVVGEVVHTVGGISHHRGIAITEQVYERISDSFKTKELPSLGVKWRDVPLRVWEIES